MKSQVKMLIIDDESYYAKVLAEALKLNHPEANIIQRNTGKDGLEAALEEEPHLYSN